MACASSHSGTLEAEGVAKEGGMIRLCQILAPRNNIFGINHYVQSPFTHLPPFVLVFFTPGEVLKLEQKDKDAKFFIQVKDLWPRCKIKKIDSFPLII